MRGADEMDWLGNAEGEAAALIRQKDWENTPLGPRSEWPQSLRTAVSICLHSRFPMLIWWGPRLVKIYNDAYRPMLGDKHPAALGRPGREVWGEIWDIIGPMLRGVLERGEATWSEDQMLPLARYGFVEECYFTFSYSPIADESGGVGGVFCAVTETTARVVGERRLQVLRDLSAVPKQDTAELACAAAVSVLANDKADLPFAAVYLVDEAQRVARLQGATGIERGSALARESVRLDVDADAAVAQVLRSGHAVAVPVAAHPDASKAFALPIARPGGGVAGVLLAGVNRRRPWDADYRAFLDFVAAQVATAIGDARAYEAERKRAEALAEIDRAKTVFFSNVSHEFRTPLTLMLGPLEAARRENGEDEALAMMHRNCLRLLKLVNSLLDFSRLEAGRVEASFQPVDLARLTAELAGVFRAAIEAAGLRLRVNCPPLPEPVWIDRDMWEKIVFNLLSNALKFTLAGEIEVSVQAAEGRAHVRVRDTGTGIPAEERTRIFQRFHRVRQARARSHEGSGIGLALVSELTRLHGGEVDVESTEGVGTTFIVSLPFGRAHLPPEKVRPGDGPKEGNRAAEAFLEEAQRWLPEPTVQEQVPAIAKSTARMSEQGRILVADDNGDMRRYVRRLLEAEGYAVETVPNGEAALAAARREAPALVLSDVMMPGLDGLALLQALRADESTRTIPVILLSARAGEEARVEGVAARADDYLTKPFSARELLARIGTHLELGRMRRIAEVVVERERRRLMELLMEAPAGICVLRGPEHVFELANEPYLRLINRGGREAVLGRTVKDVLPEVEPQGFLALLDRVFTTGEPVRGNEVRALIRQDPTSPPVELFINFTYQPTRDVNGAIDGVLVHAVDITEQVVGRRRVEELARELARDIEARERAEQERRAIDDRFRAFVEASANVIYRMSADWREMRRLEGKDFLLQTTQPNGSWIDSYIPPDEQPAVRAAIAAALRTKSMFALEHRVVRADGSIGWISSRAIPLRNDAGEVVEWFGAANDITERRRAEEALRRLTVLSEQERRLHRTILSSTPDLVYVFNLEHRFTYANAALLAMWGRTWEEAAGKNCLELGYPAWHAAMHDREIEQVIATKRPIRGEVPFTGTNGERYYDYIFVPVIGANGEVEAIAGSTRDVTERRQKEARWKFLLELNVATQRLSDPEEIMATTARLVGEHFRADRCVYAEVEDGNVFVVTGQYSPHLPRVLGRWPMAAFGEVLVQRFSANEPMVVTDTEADPQITPERAGSYREIAVRSFIGVPLFKGGGLVAAMSVHQAEPRAWLADDVELLQLVAARCWESVERVRTVRSLQASEQRLRFMAESMPQKIFTARPDGRVDYVNAQWLEFTGRTLAELTDPVCWKDVVHPDDLEENLRCWQRALETGEPLQVEHRIRRHDGEYRWHLARAQPMRDQSGRLLLWIGSNTEIEEQKRAEEQLERTVAERTARLRETIGELEAFSYSIAHDMRAPLRSLKGFSEILLSEHDAQLDPEGRGYLRRIAAAAGRMDKLIQDVLDYSRIVRGELALEPVDVAQLVRSIIETYPSFAEDRVDIILQEPIPAVRGNEAMLTQIFSNLLGNAVKFVAPGVRPEISIWAETRDGCVRLFVRDNGIGVPSHQHERIFKIFQQGELGYGGTGIGLAIVKKAAERMGGRVGLESRRGAGSTFWVDVPEA